MILYRFLYGIFIIFYLGLIHLASLWNPKARLWVNGRKRILSKLKIELEGNQSAIIWMHCSSLGEYEQGRPLLEKVRERYPAYKILLTFFSPSGYTIIKDRAVADYVYYLPFGNRLITSRFIDLVKPKLVFWIKYEYWYYYLHEFKKRNTPLLLISGTFHKNQPFFKWYGEMHRQMLHCFTHLFVQTKYSKNLLNKLGFSDKVTVSGDTRFDRVIEIAERFEPVEAIEKFCANAKVIVAGSTWPEDEEELDHYANTHPEIKFVIAPHEIHETHLKDIERLFKRTTRYSDLLKGMADCGEAMADYRRSIADDDSFSKAENMDNEHRPPAIGQRSSASDPNPSPNVLIIDNIGMLSRLYRYATITYVGGGFGEAGVHNVLEAAVYGKPVIFGPVFNKFIEAIELLEESGAFTIETALELEKVFDDLFSDPNLYMEVCEAAKRYVYSKKGATEKVLQYVQENRLLTR
ncbi:MAG TPA: glycosyltransferase N-terminal domain-containing protein [Flavitalea sp.]|nr:glycosyltransferase N-terminal domain-containing protein [Flavitalea sp.]